LQSLEIVKKEELKTSLGRIFSPQEFKNADSSSKSILIGQELKSKLFPGGRPFSLGDRVSISDCAMGGSFSIIGVLEEQDTTFDDTANSTGFTTLAAMLASGVPRRVTMFALTPIQKSISPTNAGEMVKNALILHTQNKFPFRFFAPEQQISKINLMLDLFAIITVLIGILCTIIGGVGVMNIVLAGMTERIQEIGLRKALGATNSNIRNQFLGETLILCSIAGLLGVTFGVLFANAVINSAASFFPKYLEQKLVLNFGSIFLALFGALGTGFFFGLYPAISAAKKEIISSLRME
jgi:ABC-type antimicrobial peptide transport system permease subunit